MWAKQRLSKTTKMLFLKQKQMSPPIPLFPPSSCQLENVFLKHYAPNHMPDPKGE